MKLDDTIIKKTLITFKTNYNNSKSCTDLSTGKSYVDNCTSDSVIFTGTDKELDKFADNLLDNGYNIRDFFDYNDTDR